MFEWGNKKLVSMVVLALGALFIGCGGVTEPVAEIDASAIKVSVSSLESGSCDFESPVASAGGGGPASAGFLSKLLTAAGDNPLAAASLGLGAGQFGSALAFPPTREVGFGGNTPNFPPTTFGGGAGGSQIDPDQLLQALLANEAQRRQTSTFKS